MAVPPAALKAPWCAAHRLLAQPGPLTVTHRCLQGFEGLTQCIAEYQAEREARAAAARAEEEEARLRECSFAPDINRGPRVQAKVGGRLG